MQTNTHTLLRVIILVVMCTFLSAASSVPNLTAASDVIVVARIVGGNNTQQSRELSFIVDHVLKGDLRPGVLVRAAVVAAAGRAQALLPPTLEAGLVFLKRVNDGSFSVLSAESGELGLRDAYLPLLPGQPAFSNPNSSPLEAVHQILVSSIERGSTDEQYLKRVVPKLSPTHSPFATMALRRWSESSSTQLRLLAIGSLVGTGDGQAVIALRADLMTSSSAPLARATAGSLHAFRNPDPQAVAALGDIARSSRQSKEVQEAVAAALQNVHTRESLPALYSLLDSPHASVRQTAIAGLSAFALQMRIPKDSADAMEALDEVLNPGRRRKLPAADAPFDTEEVRQFAHFGPFVSPADEARTSTFWKNWCAVNFGLTGAP
ncbi:MAG: HEAT repeat domain-containing protein [Acidobacteria bacterium]|nr:HEAT repeat domain-containing protein [Acidobacteriota bacterium]